MKISLALGLRGTLSRQTAWGCLSANLALPGSGSLAAGRKSGYGQLCLALLGLVLSMAFSVQSVVWYLANASRFGDSQEDPVAALGAVWKIVRGPLLGIGIFLIGWLWALVTGLQIVGSARKDGPARIPPRLSQP
jgi:hypothetical protein